MKSLAAFDQQHIWHPFTQHRDWLALEPLVIERGEGFELIDVEGRRYLDGVSSLWCNVHGHSHPRLLAALHEQVDRLCHSTLLGLTHQPIIEATRRLLQTVPGGLTRVFYSDSGSAAVEAAIRIALEWWQKEPRAVGRARRKLLSLANGYHGDTLGAVGLGYLEVFHRDLSENVIPSLKVPPPHLFRFYEGDDPDEAEARALAVAREVIETQADTIAALVVEPMVQGAAGIWPHSARYLQQLVQLCREHGILVVADEVATGFGKTGRMFACELAGIEPDVLVVGKSLTAGYLALSAVLTTEPIFEGFLGEPGELKTFFYGQTYCGNPLAARVTSENLALFAEEQVIESLPATFRQYHALLTEHIEPLPQVAEVRRVGVMTGIELTSEPGRCVPFESNQRVGLRVVAEARARGVIIRPLGNVIVLMPAIRMSTAELERLVRVTAEAITAAGPL
ncbi:MAG: adenosylmethionine--8-amino-7-oxononanoate transaminase [Bdellovibrionales bacterium]|nr:adenosylmethionine--8-amino-7-oxononanoate transaminase [Bdellovibrionales bacterium]